ncbi:MAG: F0F1 ATP synthase subunit epsilon [Candidatus Nanopelagicales bacterium]|nr:F0F1 ATP synthase subunit epsilon [Candidatus Nanopelagicales bacterium]MDZ4249111.1 F0F1 ATP synthase subunit epsilon [Candidatus Nanopelagicales bacterium]
MAELKVSIVAVDRPIWRGGATSIVLKTVEGDIGILPGHEPVLAMMADGPVRIDSVEGGPLLFAVHGGFFSLDSDKISILAETAESADEIDVERAKAAKQRAIAAGADDPDEIAAMHRAETRIDIAMRQQTREHL